MEIKMIRRISFENGISLNYTIKDKEISNIFEILENKIPNIVLKGGTGINRVYLKENKRFSEDIDFDIFSNKNIQNLKLDVYKILKTNLKNYIVEKPRLMNKTIRYDIKYINEFDRQDKVKLEFRYNKLNLLNNNYIIYKAISPGMIKTNNIPIYKIYKKEILIIQKLNALLNRIEGKDIYDLYYLFLLKDIDYKLLLNELNNNLLEKSINKLNIFNNNEKTMKLIQNSTNHYIFKPLKISFYILINNLIKKLEILNKLKNEKV